MRARDWLFLIVLSVLWGGTFFFVAVALQELPPLTLVLARCVIGFLVLAPFLLLAGFAFPTSAAAWQNFAVMAVFNNIIPFSLIFYGQQFVPVGLAAVLNATTPLLSLLVLRVGAGEPLTPHKVLGVVCGVAGVAVLIGPDAAAGGSQNAVIGMLAIVLAALSYGISGLWAPRIKGFPAPVSAASQLLCSSLMLLPAVALVDRFWLLPLPSNGVMAAVLALGVFSTAVAYILFFDIMRRAGALNAMLVTLLIPFTSIALGALYLGEALSNRQLLGALVIGLSLLVIDGRLFGVKQSQAKN